jgi:hypothetical protein
MPYYRFWILPTFELSPNAHARIEVGGLNIREVVT